MASIKDPRTARADCPNAPSTTAIRTSESMIERLPAPAETVQKPPAPIVDFDQVQARYG